MKIITKILSVAFLLGAVALSLEINEKIFLIYEYGFSEVIEKGIYFELKDPIITSEGDEFSGLQEIFYFVSTLIPFGILVGIKTVIVEKINYYLKERENKSN